MGHSFYSCGAVVSEQQSKWKDSIYLAQSTLCKRCSCSFDLSSLIPYCCATILSVSMYEDSPLCILNKLLDKMSATVIYQRSRNELR